MKTKIQKKFIYHGFGFPVILQNVPMLKVRGIWTPNINYNALSKTLLRALALQPGRLTGSEVRFIRQSFELSLHPFAKRLGVAHPTVVKWENAKDEFARITWSTEKDLRLWVLRFLAVTDHDFVKGYEELRFSGSEAIRKHELDLAA